MKRRFHRYKNVKMAKICVYCSCIRDRRCERRKCYRDGRHLSHNTHDCQLRWIGVFFKCLAWLFHIFLQSFVHYQHACYCITLGLILYSALATACCFNETLNMFLFNNNKIINCAYPAVEIHVVGWRYHHAL